MRPAEEMSSRQGLLRMTLADKPFLEIVYFKITFPTNHETLGSYFMVFFIENILHHKWSFKVRHRIDQNLRTILCKDNIKNGSEKIPFGEVNLKDAEPCHVGRIKKGDNFVLLFN